VERSVRGIRLTPNEWGAIALAGLLAVLLAGTFVIIFANESLRAVIVGLTAATLALWASAEVAEGFRRAGMRTAELDLFAEDRLPGRHRDERRPKGTGRQLKGVDLREAHLIGAELKGADLTEAFLEGANLSGAHLDRALLPGARLVDATLESAWLNDADLRGADLTCADLTGATLRGADLFGARLQGALLRDADLEGAILTRADLRRADLRGVMARGAICVEADLRALRSDLTELKGANLSGALTNYDRPSFRRGLMYAIAANVRRLMRRAE
jgi:uncharacterized protein YjbI with pentapeptide repeats